MISALRQETPLLSVGQRIQYFCRLRHMTQKQLGIAAQTADVRIAQYESGARTPKQKTICALASILQVSPAALSVPHVENETALLHILFALEDCCQSVLCDTFSTWGCLMEKYKAGEITKEEYDEWRYGFSFSG